MNDTGPKLYVDADKCKKNISRIFEKVKYSPVVLRPHFKTHQSGEIAEWFRDMGVSGITVSSLDMAHYFSTFGWKDIFIAFPVNIQNIKHLSQLASKIRLHLSVESFEVLHNLAEKLTSPVGIYIEIDTGDHRTGLNPKNKIEIVRILNKIADSRNLTFTGFYSHSGETYNAKTTEDVKRIYQKSVNQLLELKSGIVTSFPEAIISVGDTPSASLIGDFSPADEVRPGNFIFYDLMQASIGACSIDDIAVYLSCPVVAKHPERNEIVIHGGAVHLSKEHLTYEGKTIYGLPGKMNQNGRFDRIHTAYVKSLSQEHGIIKMDESSLDSIEIGESIAILPVHSCLTANLAKHFYIDPDKTMSKMRS